MLFTALPMIQCRKCRLFVEKFQCFLCFLYEELKADLFPASSLVPVLTFTVQHRPKVRRLERAMMVRLSFAVALVVQSIDTLNAASPTT